MRTWHEQFARLEIGNLRSRGVHHPGTRSGELAEHTARRGLDQSGLPYDLPTTKAFAAYCEDLVARMDLDRPLAAAARRVVPVGNHLAVETDIGTILSRHLVVATNPHRREIPDWVARLLGRLPGAIDHASDIDQGLVVNADEEVFEMSNGCICCTVRGDLIRVLGNLGKRRDKFDYVLVETTGLADPGPVAQTFFMDDDIAAEYALAGTVTSLAFASRSTTLASGGRDGGVLVWRLGPDGNGEAVGFHVCDGRIEAVAWRPDGRSLAAIDASGHLTTWRTGS